MTGRRGLEQPAHGGVDHAAMADHDHGCTRMAPGELGQRARDPVLERRDGLTAREADGERVAVPVGHPVAVGERLERHAVDRVAGEVLAEVVDLLDREVAERGREDLGRLDGAAVGRRDEHGGLHLAGAPPPFGERLGLLSTERREARARARPTDDALDAGVRFSVTDEDQSGHDGAGG